MSFNYADSLTATEQLNLMYNGTTNNIHVDDEDDEDLDLD